MREIEVLVVHCSDSPWGDAEVIDGWHKARVWNGIGYHFVVLNGRRKGSKRYVAEDDGVIELGRPEDVVGSHVRGHNAKSIGIVLIGRDTFTDKQMEGLYGLLEKLMDRFELDPMRVKGHYEFDSKKTCPNLDMDDVRTALMERRHTYHKQNPES